MLSFAESEGDLIGCTAGDRPPPLSFDPRIEQWKPTSFGLDDIVDVESTKYNRSFFSGKLAGGAVLRGQVSVRGLVFILEFHDYPTFLDWGRDGIMR